MIALDATATHVNERAVYCRYNSFPGHADRPLLHWRVSLFQVQEELCLGSLGLDGAIESLEDSQNAEDVLGLKVDHDVFNQLGERENLVAYDVASSGLRNNERLFKRGLDLLPMWVSDVSSNMTHLTQCEN